MKVSLGRRVADALIGTATWLAAAGVALWFFDWVNRWYVVTALLLGIVAVAMIVDGARSSKPDDARLGTPQRSPSSVASLPLPRDGELLDAEIDTPIDVEVDAEVA